MQTIGPDGAILVRPDSYVAFRVARLPADPEAELERAFRYVLSLADDGFGEASKQLAGTAQGES